MESQHNQTKKIAVDTNVLLAIIEKKIDAIEEAKKQFGKATEIVVPTAILQELDYLQKKSKTKQKAVNIAKKMIELHGIKEIKTSQEIADNALLELARNNYSILTLDKELKKRIKKAHGSIIELSKGHIKDD
jgi:rRNA-processing protein FCF1